MRPSRSAPLPSSILSTPNSSSLLLCILIFCTFSFAAAPDRITSAIDLSQTIALAKSHHPKAQPQYDRGPVDPSFELSYITLLMAPSASQQQAINQLLVQQQDRRSPLYHKWLTLQQYAERFGLNQKDLGKITTWLTSEGFQILSIGGGQNTVIFSGTVLQVQRAFGTEIHNYTVDGAEHFANATPLQVPAALRGIVTSVMGLHDFRPRPASGGGRFGATRKTRPAYYDGGYLFPNFLAPGDIATIYDIGSLYTAGIDGTGETLAVVGQTDIYLDDLNDFRSGFGLATISCTTDSNNIITACNDPHFKYVLNGPDVGVNPQADDLGEADLDLEWSGAVAHNAQIIYVNNGGTAGGVYDALAWVISPNGSTTPLSTVVSMSYGYCEAFATDDLEPLLKQGNLEGVTILNASGDVASAACDYTPPNNAVDPPFSAAQYGLAVSYPASSPEVTGVGGTEISLANDSYPTQSAYWTTPAENPLNGGTAVKYIPEIPWNDVEQFAAYCHEPAQGDTFCSTGGGTIGWVPLPLTATAAQVQADIWIEGGGGGASNCWYETEGDVCLGAGPGPSGGGFAQPFYQQGLSVPGAPTGVRYVPDISMMSSPDFPGYIFCTAQSELGGSVSTSTCVDGIFDAVDDFGSLIGGTSVATPVFAGIVALLNQYVVTKGIQTAPGLGNINPLLYQLAAVPNSTIFNKVTTGDNMVYCQPGLPAGEPIGIMCPEAGVFGFEASNADSKTGYNLVTGLGSVDANKLAGALATVGTTPTATTLTSSLNPASFGAAVTFTATVTTTGANPPTGSVTFNDGTTVLGTGTLSTVSGSQVATFTISTLASGTHSITAVYGGDANDASSTSAILSQVITAPTFTWTAPVTSATVAAGQVAAYNFTATPKGGATTFAGNVTFACTGLPAATTCAFTPSQIAAGAGVTPVQVAISTSGPNPPVPNQLRRVSQKQSPWLPLALPLAGIVLVGFAGRKLSKHSAIAGLSASMLLLALLVACGGGGGNSTPPVSVAVSQGVPSSVYPNNTGWPSQTAQFTATVSNTSNTAVTWSVATANGGTINSAGLYTAPNVASGLPTSVTITATSVADTTKSGSASETLTAATIPGTYTITVTATESTTVVSTPVTLTVQ